MFATEQATARTGPAAGGLSVAKTKWRLASGVESWFFSGVLLQGKNVGWIILPLCFGLVAGIAIGMQRESRSTEKVTIREAELKRKIEALESGIQADKAVTQTDPTVLEGLKSSRDLALAEASRMSNVMSQVLRESTAFRQDAAKSIEEAKSEIMARSKRIEALEAELGALNQQLRDLGERLARQNARVAEAERMLASSEGDKTSIRSTLNALLAEKMDLEKKLQAKESAVAEVRKTRNREYAARDSIFRKNWLLALRSADETSSSTRKAPEKKPEKPAKEGSGSSKSAQKKQPASSAPAPRRDAVRSSVSAEAEPSRGSGSK